jgi:hypothetical protein
MKTAEALSVYEREESVENRLDDLITAPLQNLLP